MSTLYSYNKQEFNADVSFNNTSTRISSTGLIGISGGIVNISGGVINLSSNSIIGNGNVGIGTANPASNLHINGSSVSQGTNISRIIQGNGSYNSVTDVFQDPFTINSATVTADCSNLSIGMGVDTTNKIGYINVAQSGAVRPLYLNCRAGAPVIALGNVGIGTTNPGAKLEVRYSGIAADQTVLKLDTGETATNNYNLIQAGHGGVPNFVVKGSGNVGIGTTSPGYKCEVYDANSSFNIKSSGGQYSSQISTLYLSNSSYINASIAAGDRASSSGGAWNSDLMFNLSRDGILNERMRITSGGNVGIGLTNPGAKMHVNGTIYGNNGSTNDVGLTISSSGAGWGSGFRLENTTATNGRTWGAYSASSGNYIAINDATNGRAVLEVVKDTKDCFFYGNVNVNTGGSRNAVIHDGIYYTKWGGGYYGQIYQNENTMTYISYGDIGRYGKHEFWSGDFITNNSVRKNVSIGSVYPLEVHSYYNLTSFGGVGYMNDYITRSASSFNDYIGMNVNDGAVRALGFYAYSDKRIKTNIVDIDDAKALSILRQIQPKTYDYVDKLQRGNANVIGFIAQEIKEILPKAVTIVKDYIPTFYTVCQVAPTDASNIVLVTSPIDLSWNALHDPSGNAFVDAEGNACSDAAGNKVFNVKLYDQSNNNFECKTTSILDKRSFLMDVSGSKMVDASGNLQLVSDGKYFLHGQEVDDFHNIDKGAIFTVVTAAVQDIDRQVQAQSVKQQADEAKIAALEQQVASLQTENASLQSQLSTLQTQMTAVLSKLSM